MVAYATIDLITRWQIRHPRRSKTGLPDVLADLKDSIAAGTRLIVELGRLKRSWLDYTLRPFVEQLAAQNATIGEMVDAMGGDEIPQDQEPVQAASTMPTVLAYLSDGGAEEDAVPARDRECAGGHY